MLNRLRERNIHLILTYQVSSAKLDSQSAQRMKSLLPWLGHTGPEWIFLVQKLNLPFKCYLISSILVIEIIKAISTMLMDKK